MAARIVRCYIGRLGRSRNASEVSAYAASSTVRGHPSRRAPRGRVRTGVCRRRLVPAHAAGSRLLPRTGRAGSRGARDGGRHADDARRRSRAGRGGHGLRQSRRRVRPLHEAFFATSRDGRPSGSWANETRLRAYNASRPVTLVLLSAGLHRARSFERTQSTRLARPPARPRQRLPHLARPEHATASAKAGARTCVSNSR